ncbi:MAG TPA: ASCH domain-containing protein, partial [Vicinamibacterales bacterium]|nr:ASCH domain-containing protein [Vicinamibacterales bacterium]
MATIKALSLHQPWATWIAEGHKTAETRMWDTRYRGPLLICASRHGAHRNGDQAWVLARDTDERLREFPVGVALCIAELTYTDRMMPADEPFALCAC